jgi:hypothetical protein
MEEIHRMTKTTEDKGDDEQVRPNENLIKEALNAIPGMDKIEQALKDTPGIREYVFKEILLTQPRVIQYLKTDLATLDAKKIKLEDYLEREKEYDKKKDRLKIFRLLRYYPEPDRLLFAALVTILSGIIIKIWPFFANIILTDYARETTAETMFYISGLSNVFLFAILGFFIATAGKVMFVWAKCSITNRPVVELETRYNTDEFICPSKVTPDVVRVSKYGAVIPDPEATPTGPHGRKIIKCVPEWGVAVSIRNLLKGGVHNFDMTVLEEYYELGAQEMRKQLQSHTSWITPGLIAFVLILSMVGLLFGPQAMEAIRGMNNEQACRADLYAAQLELTRHGIDPGTIHAETSSATTTTTTIRAMTPSIENALPAVGLS